MSMSEKKSQRIFLSGNDAVAHGVRLARPHVIAAYPITPQTTVVERLADMVADGSLTTEYMYVESEHSAMSACIGASSVGARTFTATSSQGLLYMAECLQYASGGRFPVVMMNANRALALPWNIYGDQQDSISQIHSGWLQVYVETAQEALDVTLQAYAIAENQAVSLPVMVNLDGFVLTHTYEPVEVPSPEEADAFLPPFDTQNKMDLDHPRNLGFTAGPQDYTEFKALQHYAMITAKDVIKKVDADFAAHFGRSYGGLVEAYRCEDAEAILITLGSITGLVREVVDALRADGKKAGVLKLRYLRPFPVEEIIAIAGQAQAIGVLEKDISLGYQGAVFSEVSAALQQSGLTPFMQNFVAGLGGRDISGSDIEKMYAQLLTPNHSPGKVFFTGLRWEQGGRNA
jgi:pyruvate ferredoxin oxidoreductase alpha subunit